MREDSIMKKSSLRTLKERSIASSISKNNTYAQLLKRKRNEKRRTLEELAYGICSPSYLSKIENANVEVDEQYYQLLFEKLDIPYENILTNRNSQIFQEMIKKYLLYQYDEIQMIVNDAISSNTYCETELELLLLFSNIIRGFYEEAKLLMVKLEDLRNSLNNKELLFFVYLTALYFYKTNQTERAYQYLLVLCEIKYEDEIFKFAVYDLATEVFYLYGAYALFYQYYHLITTLEPVFLIAKRVTNHRMRALVLNASYTNILATEEMESFKTIIDLNDEEQRENYYYYLGCCYYQTNQYLKVLESTRDVKSARINALIASALNRIGDIKTALNYFDDLKKYSYTIYESVYAKHVEYIRRKFEQYNYTHLMSLLKNDLLVNQKDNFHAYFYQMEMFELASLGYEMGRYKETLRYTINNWMRIVNK